MFAAWAVSLPNAYLVIMLFITVVRLRAQAVANKGEPYRFGIESSPEAVQQFVMLHGFRLHKFLSPK